jgi:sigma-B regulation protein RsbU (phosphoserine phosphatase)
MVPRQRSWQDELAIIDRVMKSVSDITDPEEMVSVYWQGIAELLPIEHFLALSRRQVKPPDYIITRSSRFAEELNPWTQRDRLPRLRGGLLGEIAYADRPLLIEDLPDRLAADDPGRFYLDGFGSLVALPQYEGGRGVNIGIILFAPGVELDPRIIPMMHWQASLFGRGTQSLVLRNQLKAALDELDRELQIVGEIQRSLLPTELPALDGWDIAASYETSARAGGDYYDFFPVGLHEWGLLIADVAGHGTPAAVLMAITHAIARSRPGVPTPPGELLGYVNRHLARSYTRSGSFVTAFYAVLDTRTGTLTYANAGHPPPRLARDGRVLDLDQGGGLPLGILEDEVFGEATVAISSGDRLALYTDGITETMSAAPEPDGSPRLFGTERLDRAIIAAPSDAAALIARVHADLSAHSDSAAAADDRTLVVLIRRP